MSAAELLLGPGATGAGVTDVPWFGPIIGMLCVAPPVLVGIDAFSAPASDRGGGIAGETAPDPLAAHPPGDVTRADAPPAFALLVAAFVAWSAYFSRRSRSAAAGKTTTLMLGIGFGAAGLALASFVYGSRTSADVLIAAIAVVAVSYVGPLPPPSSARPPPAVSSAPEICTSV